MKSKKAVKIACKRAMQNIIYEGVSDVSLLSRPFEIDAMCDSTFAGQLRNLVVDSILENNFELLKVKPIKHILIPKKTLADFRDCAVIDVIDETIYLTLALSIARQIEEHRINKSKKTVFSYRLNYCDEGMIFDSEYSYQSFYAEVRRRKALPKNNVMVSCDIASYYDRINLHRLNSCLLSLDNVDEDIAELIDELLLFWSNRNSYGLPVGSNASRILAEAELIEVDNYLLQHGVSFCRYVDDFRLFAANAMEANKDLELLVYALKREGLFLNSGKTRIHDISAQEPQNNTNNDELKRNDESERGASTETKRHPLIIAGYAGLIPTKYRKPQPSEWERLGTFDIEGELQTAVDSIVLDSEKYRDIVKATEVQDRYERLLDIVKLTEKCPQFVPYIVDYLKKNSSSVTSRQVDEVSDFFEAAFLSNETPEFVRVSLSDLYTSIPFERPNMIVQAYLGLRADSGDYLGRVFLERLAGKTTRLETLDLRDRGRVTDLNELRALARVVSRGLPTAEANAYLKNLAIHYDDLFIKRKKL